MGKVSETGQKILLEQSDLWMALFSTRELSLQIKTFCSFHPCAPKT
jgi:hypothetical protein